MGDDRDTSAGPESEKRTGRLYVCPYSAIDVTVETCSASRLLTCLHDNIVQTPRSILPERHLRLIMHDIAEPLPDYTPPDGQHIEQLIDFARDWGGEGAMVVHCWAGISRSTAAAFVSLCTINPDVPEHLIAQRLREASPTAYPNRLMVRLADDALARRGRMVDAVERVGRGVLASEAEPFWLPARIAADDSR